MNRKDQESVVCPDCGSRKVWSEPHFSSRPIPQKSIDYLCKNCGYAYCESVTSKTDDGNDIVEKAWQNYKNTGIKKASSDGE